MTTGEGAPGRTPEPGGDHGGDYGYDEAHRDLPEGTAGVGDGVPAAPPSTRDPGGDYGYDEAHDFRR